MYPVVRVPDTVNFKMSLRKSILTKSYSNFSWYIASVPGLPQRIKEVGTDHVSDHALRFSSDVSMELMYRLSFCRNCESLHPGVGLNGKSS